MVLRTAARIAEGAGSRRPSIPGDVLVGGPCAASPTGILADTMRQTIDTLDWTVLAAYALLLTGIALYHARRMKAQDDVFLAGRSMSRWPIALSMYMALFSTNSFLGVTGWLNRPDGTIWIGLQNVGMVAAVPLVVWLYPGVFYRLRITTAYEYLERRFSYGVRAAAALLFLGARITWMSTMLYASSLVVSAMLGWTPDRGIADGQARAILVVGALGILFALAGGMRAVIWTDAVQFFVMFGAVVTTAVLAISHSGGLTSVLATAADAGKFRPPPPAHATAELSIASGLLLGFVSMLSSAGTDQVVLQTYLTARNEREAKRSLRRNGFLLKPLSLVFPVLGVIIFAYYQVHPDVAARMRIPDDALPVFVLHVLPSGMRGLMIAAIVAAVLTSLDSGMAALSAAVQVDFVRRWMKRPLSDRGAVLLGRALILGWGLTIIGVALWVRRLGAAHNIIQILNIVMYPFTGVLLGVFLLGLLTRRANAAGTMIGAAGGFIIAASLPLSRTVVATWIQQGADPSSGLIGHVIAAGRISSFYYGALAALATMAGGYLASLLFRAPAREQVVGLTRWDPPQAPASAAASATGPR